jgi:hypothetical protein
MSGHGSLHFSDASRCGRGDFLQEHFEGPHCLAPARRSPFVDCQSRRALRMVFPRGLFVSAICAAIAAAVWIALITVTGWSLWLLAPLVGGAAGYGMMRATQMRGGVSAGVVAVLVTFVTLFASRFYVISAAVDDVLAVNEETAIEHIAFDVVNDWHPQGLQVHDDNGDLHPAVLAEARKRWDNMWPDDRHAMMQSLEGDRSAVSVWLTPVALFVDFGIIGSIMVVLTCITAYKTGSRVLEEVLVEQGHAGSVESAGAVAARLRAGETVAAPGQAQQQPADVSTSTPVAPVPAAATGEQSAGGAFFSRLGASEPKAESTFKGFQSDDDSDEHDGQQRQAA